MAYHSCKVRYFTCTGAVDATKVTLRSVHCRLHYNYAQFGNKHDRGFQYYPVSRPACDGMYRWADYGKAFIGVSVLLKLLRVHAIRQLTSTPKKKQLLNSKLQVQKIREGTSRDYPPFSGGKYSLTNILPYTENLATILNHKFKQIEKGTGLYILVALVF